MRIKTDKMNHKFETPKSTIGNRNPVLSEAEWIENPLGSCVLDTVFFLLIHPFTHPLIHFFMQNEPNFKTRKPNKQENGVVFYYHLFQKNHQLFKKKSKKIQKNALCKFQTLTHLTPCTKKTYITFSTQNTGHGPRETRDQRRTICKTNPI
jgi:hypothetical protein